jgi:cysteinyl-tRNA synthetase
MSWKYLGETFDIHGGGIDLVFPHHEDEIAQSRCAFHTPVMANYWMHNGFLQVEGEKMAKSTGNFVTIRELLETNNFGERKWLGEVLRLAMLRTHYRQPLDWTVKALEEAEKNLFRWLRTIHDALGRDALTSGRWPTSSPRQQVIFEICDDLNTPSIITGLSVVARSLSNPQYRRMPAGSDDAWEFIADLSLLGLVSEQRIAKLLDEALGVPNEMDANEISTVESLIERRTVARKAKDFAESDRIRDELAKMGVVLKDTKDGTAWEIAR